MQSIERALDRAKSSELTHLEAMLPYELEDNDGQTSRWAAYLHRSPRNPSDNKPSDIFISRNISS